MNKKSNKIQLAKAIEETRDVAAKCGISMDELLDTLNAMLPLRSLTNSPKVVTNNKNSIKSDTE